MKYLKIQMEGCHPGCEETVYVDLDSRHYEPEALVDLAQAVFNEHYGNWSQEVVDESEVPEDER